MIYDAQTIDRAIGAYMGANRITASDFAKSVGISTPVTLRRKRLGESEWSFNEICKVAELTGLSLDALAGLDVAGKVA